MTTVSRISADGNLTIGDVFYQTQNTNYAIDFNGSNYIQSATNAYAALQSSDFTIECWVNFTDYSANSYRTFFTNYDDPFVAGCIYMGKHQSYTGKVSIWFASYSTSGAMLVENDLPPAGWNHYAVTRQGSTFRLFRNGVLSATGTYSGSVTSSTAFARIGTGLLGSISNHRIIIGTALYTAAFTPPTGPLTAITNTTLLTCQSPTIVDNSGNNITITNVSSCLVNKIGTITYNNSFNGSNQYLSIPSNPIFALGKDDFTIEMWVNPKSAVGYQCIFLISGANPYVYLGINTGSTGTPFLWSDSAIIVGSTNFTLNTWQHFALVRSSGTCTMYLNGISIGSSSALSGFMITGQLTIGATSGPIQYFTGDISNVRVVGGTALYTSSFSPPREKLQAIAGTKLLTCQSSSIFDNSPNALSITNVNGVTVSGAPVFPQAPSQLDDYSLNNSNYAVRLNGSSQWITLPNSSAFDFGTSTDFTIEAWINPSTLAAGGGGNSDGSSILSCYPASGTITGWTFTMGTTGYIGMTVYASGTQQTFYSSTNPVVINTWNHVAFTRSGSTCYIFVNGVLLTSSSSSITQAINSGGNTIKIGTLQIGTYYDNFTGYISNIRVVKGTAVYTSSFTPATSPLTAIPNTSLLACQSPTIIDNSLYTNTLTNVGSATVDRIATTFYKNYISSSSQYLTVPNNTGFDFGTGDFTIEAWVYPTTLTPGGGGSSNWSVILSTFPSSGVGNGYSFGYNGTGYLQFDTFLSGNEQILTATSNPVSINTWYHIAITKQSGTFKFFVNGVSATFTGTISQAVNTNGNTCKIGQQGYTGYIDSFTGYISNVRMVKGTAVYTSNFTPSTQQLTAIANTVLLTCQSSSIIDNSVYNSSISNTGSVTVQNPILLGTVKKQYSDGSLQTLGDIDEYTIPNSRYFVSFINNTQSLSITPNSNFNFGTNNFTIECWVCPTTVGGGVIKRIYSQETGTNSVCFRENSGNVLEAFFRFGSSTVVTLTGSVGLTLNNWQHLALVRNGTTFTLYKNGVSIGTITNSGAIDVSAATIQICNGGTEPFYGYQSNVRVVTGTALYTTNFTPPIKALTAINGTQLLTCQTPKIVDNSLNNFTISNNGSAVSYPIFNLHTVNFSGASQYLRVPYSSAFDFSQSTWTLECWFKANAFDLVILSKDTYGTNFDFCMYVSATSIFSQTAGTALNYSVTTGLTLSTGVWYHLAMVRNAGTLNYYLNGVKYGAGSTMGITNASQSYVTLGCFSWNNPSGYMNGSVSNLRMVQGTALYTSNFTPKQTNLPAISGTSFLSYQSPTIVDNSKNAITITNYNSVTVTPPIFPQTLSAVQSSNGVYQIAGEFDEYSGVSDIPIMNNVSFNGSSQYISATNANGWLPSTNTNWTIEAYIFLSGYSVGSGSYSGVIASAQPTNTNNSGWAWNLFGTASSWTGIGVNWWAVANTNTPVSGSYSFNLNTWYHVAMVRNGATLTLYVNGLAIGSGTPSFSDYTVLNIGRVDVSGYYCWFPGHISNLRIVNGTSIYKSNFTPPTSPLNAVPGTKLLTCQSPTIIDNSPNAFTLTNNNTAVVNKVFNYNLPYTYYYPAYFSGTQTRLSTASSTVFDLSGGIFTFECWVYLLSYPASTGSTVSRFVMIGPNDSYSSLCVFAMDNNGGCGAGVPKGGVNGVGIGTIPLNAWTHLALSVSGSTAKGFLNGVMNGSVTNFTIPTSASNILYIGNDSVYPVDAKLNGYMTNFRYIKGTALYTAAFTPPTTTLTAITNTAFLAFNSQQSIFDTSSNALNINNDGTVTVVNQIFN